MTSPRARHEALPTVEPGANLVSETNRRITLYFENLIVADIKQALCAVEFRSDLQELVFYLPPKDVISVLAANTHRATCTVKGVAMCFGLFGANGAVVALNATSSYANPTPQAARIRDRIAFNNRSFTFEILPR